MLLCGFLIDTWSLVHAVLAAGKADVRGKYPRRKKTAIFYDYLNQKHYLCEVLSAIKKKLKIEFNTNT